MLANCLGRTRSPVLVMDLATGQESCGRVRKSLLQSLIQQFRGLPSFYLVVHAA